jgi:uncharacterized protein
VSFYQMHGAALALFGAADLAADQGRPGPPSGRGPSRSPRTSPPPRRSTRPSRQALAAGATPLKTPEAVFWGGYSGYWADPDGHVWEVAMNPFWPLAEDGSLTLPEAP